jgi:hypothetical protein
MQKLDRITIDPAKMNGEPCIRGLRLTVRRRVLEALATYPDREELKREYPELQAASKGLHAKPISAETWKGSVLGGAAPWV